MSRPLFVPVFFLDAVHEDEKESDGQATAVATNGEKPEVLGDGEDHVSPSDPDATAAGDVHVFANTCQEGG